MWLWYWLSSLFPFCLLKGIYMSLSYNSKVKMLHIVIFGHILNVIYQLFTVIHRPKVNYVFYFFFLFEFEALWMSFTFLGHHFSHHIPKKNNHKTQKQLPEIQKFRNQYLIRFDPAADVSPISHSKIWPLKRYLLCPIFIHSFNFSNNLFILLYNIHNFQDDMMCTCTWFTTLKVTKSYTKIVDIIYYPQKKSRLL